MSESEKRAIANHLLPTSSHLPGLCFVTLRPLRATGVTEQTRLDEFIGVAILLVLTGLCMLACISAVVLKVVP